MTRFLFGFFVALSMGYAFDEGFTADDEHIRFERSEYVCGGTLDVLSWSGQDLGTIDDCGECWVDVDFDRMCPGVWR